MKQRVSFLLLALFLICAAILPAESQEETGAVDGSEVEPSLTDLELAALFDEELATSDGQDGSRTGDAESPATVAEPAEAVGGIEEGEETLEAGGGGEAETDAVDPVPEPAAAAEDGEPKDREQSETLNDVGAEERAGGVEEALTPESLEEGREQGGLGEGDEEEVDVDEADGDDAESMVDEPVESDMGVEEDGGADDIEWMFDPAEEGGELADPELDEDLGTAAEDIGDASAAASESTPALGTDVGNGLTAGVGSDREAEPPAATPEASTGETDASPVDMEGIGDATAAPEAIKEAGEPDAAIAGDDGTAAVPEALEGPPEDEAPIGDAPADAVPSSEASDILGAADVLETAPVSDIAAGTGTALLATDGAVPEGETPAGVDMTLLEGMGSATDSAVMSANDASETPSVATDPTADGTEVAFPELLAEVSETDAAAGGDVDTVVPIEGVDDAELKEALAGGVAELDTDEEWLDMRSNVDVDDVVRRPADDAVMLIGMEEAKDAVDTPAEAEEMADGQAEPMTEADGSEVGQSGEPNAATAEESDNVHLDGEEDASEVAVDESPEHLADVADLMLLTDGEDETGVGAGDAESLIKNAEKKAREATEAVLKEAEELAKRAAESAKQETTRLGNAVSETIESTANAGLESVESSVKEKLTGTRDAVTAGLQNFGSSFLRTNKNEDFIEETPREEKEIQLDEDIFVHDSGEEKSAEVTPEETRHEHHSDDGHDHDHDGIDELRKQIDKALSSASLARPCMWAVMAISLCAMLL